jgi:spermidine/putrescine transport system substrate-binding protein
MGDWDKAHQVTFSSSYIGDHNEIQAKLTTAKSVGYDLVTYFQGYSEMYAKELKLLQPIDASKLSNFPNLYERFRTGDAWLKDGQIWGVPFTWGAEGCNYNADKIDPPQSWKDLLKPEFKGKVSMVDVMFDQVIFAGIVLGFRDTLPNLTSDQLAQVKDFLLQMKRQSRSIAPSYGDLTDQLVSGEIVATFPGWAAINVWAADRKVNVKMTIPAEGGYCFCDALAIPAQSDNVDTVLAWINEAISPQVQACQAANLAAGVVNSKAISLLDKNVAAMYDYDHMDEFFKKAPFYTLPPNKSDKYSTYDQWTAMWEEVKAA